MESLLLKGPQDRKIKQKQITILLHTQEGERYRAFACMVFNADKDFMVAQVSESGLCFMTMAQVKDKAHSRSHMISPIKSPLATRLATKRGDCPSARIRTTIDFEDKGTIKYFSF